MGAGTSSSAGRVYRPSRVLAFALGLSGAIWIAALVGLSGLRGVSFITWASCAGFVLFFAIALAYAIRAAIFIDPDGLTYRGLLKTCRFGFGEIRKLDVLGGPLTVYAVRTGTRWIHFSSFFARHRDLARLVVERARLDP